MSVSGILFFYLVLRVVLIPKTTNKVMSVNPIPSGLLIFVQASFLRMFFDRVKQESSIVNTFVDCCMSEDGITTHVFNQYNCTMKLGGDMWLV